MFVDCVDRVQLEGAPCPCSKGLVCCDELQICMADRNECPTKDSALLDNGSEKDAVVGDSEIAGDDTSDSGSGKVGDSRPNKNEECTGEAGITTAVEICDGSDSIRLSFRDGGGRAYVSGGFNTPGGLYTLLVDGHCNYWLLTNRFVGIRTGTLTDLEANKLAADLRLDRLSNCSGYYDQEGCWGGGPTQSISNSSSNGTTSTIKCHCGCYDAPTPVVEVVGEMYMWYTIL